ncbi:MAG: leucine-rich repeat domain-containing protein, partial [Butyrivibrio sp.]|nr:leucine-rich repeat domain-containing protein [Butyrivibrio sp.]
ETHGDAVFTTTCKAYYVLQLYDSNNSVISSWHLGVISSGVTREVDTHVNILSSSTYTFKVKSCTNNTDTSFDSGVITDSSPGYVYNRPSNVLPAPTNLAWSSTDVATATWDTVQNASEYLCLLYRNQTDPVIGLSETENYSDFSDYIGDSSDVPYTFKVRAISSDIEVYANGDYSSMSASYNNVPFTNPDSSTGDSASSDSSSSDSSSSGSASSDSSSSGSTQSSTTVESTTESINNASSASAAQSALDSYISNNNMQALAVSMQTDSSTRDKISSLESAYTSKAGISVANNITASGVDSSKISILGAGLNANANESVSFNVGYTDESAKKAIDTKYYTNIVQFDMSLSNAGRVSSDGSLAVPVVITMPVPEGLVKDITLSILHFHHSDDGYDLIKPRFNSDGTISFTIRHFSTFGFTNALEQGSTVTDKSGNIYTVTGDDTVEFTAPSAKTINKITIGATVNIGGSEFKVTSIANNAFSKCSKLKTLKIGSNVTTIGAGAFKSCKRLKSITISANSVSTIGKKAFKGISSKATFKINSKNTKKYNTLVKAIKKSGAKKASFKMKKSSK